LLDVLVAAGLADGGDDNFICEAAETTRGFGFVCAFTTVFFLAVHFFVTTGLARGLAADAFTVAAFLTTGFAGGFAVGVGPNVFACVTNATGFTPAAAAVFAADKVRGAGFSIPRKSGFTTICLS